VAEGIRIDIGDLTLGELEEFEDIAGMPAAALTNGTPPAKAITALVYLSQKRENPAYTLDDARKERVTSLKFGGDEPDPTGSPAEDVGGG